MTSLPYIRLPGLFRRDELSRVLETGMEYRFVSRVDVVGEIEPGELFEVWSRHYIDGDIATPARTGCNRHDNCAGKTNHCFAEDCEDCFGK